jgi:hypothetical protein
MARRSCFVIAPIGDEGTVERKRSDQLLRHLIRPVLEAMQYDVRRADDLHEEGLITHQIIERLIEGDLVVADLTGRNPNVFYELAVRHAAQKPVVHLIEDGEALPFDVANVRAISFSLADPDLLASARDDLAHKVQAIESAAGQSPNPIHAALNLQSLRESNVPEAELAGSILSGIADLRVELQNLSQRLTPSAPTTTNRNTTHFRVGDQVVHATFGEGEIVGTEEDGIVIVDFRDGSTRKLMAAYAPLSLARPHDDIPF